MAPAVVVVLLLLLLAGVVQAGIEKESEYCVLGDSTPWLASSGNFAGYQTDELMMTEQSLYRVLVSMYPSSVSVTQSAPIPPAFAAATMVKIPAQDGDSKAAKLVLAPDAAPDQMQLISVDFDTSTWTTVSTATIPNVPVGTVWEHATLVTWNVGHTFIYLYSVEFIAWAQCFGDELDVCKTLAATGDILNMDKAQPPRHPVTGIAGAGVVSRSKARLFVGRQGNGGGPSEIVTFKVDQYRGTPAALTAVYLQKAPSAIFGSVPYGTNEVIVWAQAGQTAGEGYVFCFCDSCDSVSGNTQVLQIDFSHSGEAFSSSYYVDAEGPQHFVLFSGAGSNFDAWYIDLDLSYNDMHLRLLDVSRQPGYRLPETAMGVDFIQNGMFVVGTGNSTSDVLMLMQTSVYGDAAKRPRTAAHASADASLSCDSGSGLPETCHRCNCGGDDNACCGTTIPGDECFQWVTSMCCCHTPPY